jgi:uncharacterized membrane protein YhaH (DUF805 family)
MQTTTSQFGRRGAPARGAAQSSAKAPTGSALQSATQWNRDSTKAASAPGLSIDAATYESIVRPRHSDDEGGSTAGSTRGMDAATMFFSFDGRMRRSHYWMAMIIYTIAYTLAQVALFTAHLTPNMFLIVDLPFNLALLWVAFCVQSKRWHDRGRSAAWFLIGFIPLLGGLWTLIECGLIDGDPGANRYGPSPKAYAPINLPA